VIRRLVRELDLVEHVRFLPPVPYRELPSIYSLGDVFVLPGRVVDTTGQVEGFGTVFLEASACGLPVIGGRTGGMVEAVEDSVTGFLVESEDDDALGTAILNIFRYRDRAVEMGLRGRDRVIKKYGWEDRSVNLWEYMLEAIERHRLSLRRGEQ
jgi:phosphatidylinositol alpha-1,6-mannosyltransferase